MIERNNFQTKTTQYQLQLNGRTRSEIQPPL